ncbi:hypothetical protein LAZ67_4000513 [Cordylochernes scorpioides]|uniref:Reverse transcriptase n=1 Tax=Cordylochernes scorpioides TaxID=51811 RepID=A0ABY6KBQ3_9ARAC|nr:hypothetical protein LAZ67_4000513 [Cordylochernes scorpioides]
MSGSSGQPNLYEVPVDDGFGRRQNGQVVIFEARPENPGPNYIYDLVNPLNDIALTYPYAWCGLPGMYSSQSDKCVVQSECWGCGHAITDRVLLRADGRSWHVRCLQCSSCRETLDGHPSCFFREEGVFCRADYLRRFVTTWLCFRRRFVTTWLCFMRFAATFIWSRRFVTTWLCFKISVTTWLCFRRRFVTTWLCFRRFVTTWLCFRRRFGVKCSKCGRPVQAADWVRRARHQVYHLACFACEACKRQLSTGEEFALLAGKVLCKAHYVDSTPSQDDECPELKNEEDSQALKKYSSAVETTFAELINFIDFYERELCELRSNYLEHNTTKAPAKRPREKSPVAAKETTTQKTTWCPNQRSQGNPEPKLQSKQPEKPNEAKTVEMEIEVTPNKMPNHEQNHKNSNPPKKPNETLNNKPNNPTPNPKIRIPPIKISGVKEWSGLRDGLVNCTKQKPEFYTSGRYINVQTHTTSDYRIATKWLEDRHYTFHFKILDDEKCLRVVVRGLDRCITIPEIQEDLENKGFEMSKLARLRNSRTKEELPLIQVTLPKTARNKEIYNITDLCDMKCNVEAYRAPKGPGQCHRCQNFGHSQFECRETPKCVKCGENHFTSECAKEKEVPPKCANCQGQHTASWRGCPLYRKINRVPQTQINKKPNPNTEKEKSNPTGPNPSEIPQPTQNKNKTPYVNKERPNPPSATKVNQLESAIKKALSDPAIIENIMKNVVDTFRLSETWLKPCHKMRIQNFITLRNDRLTGQGGGTAIFIHKKYSHAPIHATTSSLETTGISIKNKNGLNMNLYSCYKPPNTYLDQTDIYNIFSTDTPTIIAGDLNCKHPAWGSTTTNPSGRRLQNAINVMDLDVSYPDEPTHDSPPDIIDIAVHKNISQSAYSKVLHELTSDHLPVLLVLQDFKISYSNTKIKITDWALFKYKMEIAEPPELILDTSSKIDEAITHIEEQMVQNLKDSTKYKDPELERRYPPHIKEKIRFTNRLRKKMKITCDPRDKSAYMTARRESQKLTREHDNTSWDHFIENLKVTDQTIWKAIKRLSNSEKQEITLKTNNGQTLTTEEAAESFANNYEKQFTPNPYTSHSKPTRTYIKRVNSYMKKNKETGLEPTNIGEIKAIIEYLPNKKAPGIDELPNEALKLLPNHILASITEIFNASLQLAHFPDRWKTSIICPILKKGKSIHEPTSYRPISLLPAISKLFERIVLRRLRKSLEEKNPLRPEQFGYQAKHSTLHQLVVVTEKIRKAMDLGQITGAVFFDIAKAFDKVWHEALLYKMCKKHLPGDIIKITQNFLTNRTFKVRVKNELSTARNILAGVPQGSVTGPTLFDIFIDDFPCIEDTSLHLFADDTAILASTYNFDNLHMKLQEACILSTLWSHKTILKKLEVFENKMIRKIMSPPWFVRNTILRNDLNIENINDYIIRQSFKFYEKSEKLENPTFKEATNYKCGKRKIRNLKPRQILHQLSQNDEKWKKRKNKPTLNIKQARKNLLKKNIPKDLRIRTQRHHYKL